jgi:ferredoxin
MLQKGGSMSDRNNFIVSVAFLSLLALAPIMVAEEETGRFAGKESVEKGSGKIVVDQIIFAAGTKIKAGEYDVKWESHGPDVTVEFTPIGKAQGVKVPGRIVEVNEKFDSDSMVIAKDPDGRNVMKELKFSGIKILFECDNPSCFHSQGNSEFPAYQVSAAGKDPWELNPAEKIYG